MTDFLTPDDASPAGDPAEHDADRQRGAQALATLADDPARTEFRARLRQAFVAGTIASTVVATPRAGVGRTAAGAPSPRTAGGAPPIGVGGVVRMPRRAAAWAGVLIPLAAAAGLAIVVLMDRGPAWRVTNVSGVGIAVVDQRPIPLNHVDELTQMLRPGARVRVPEGTELEITSGRILAVRMLSGTEAVVPPTPGRWFHRRLTGRIEHGQWRVTTGPQFAGAQLEIVTPHAHIEVTGTTLAVICEPEGTCVCVYEGRVRVGHNPTDMAPIVEGHLRYVFASGEAPKNAEIRPIENEQLGAFRQQKRAEFAGAK